MVMTETAGQIRFHAMGTSCHITGANLPPAFRAAALRWVAEFEARYSRFLPGSLISRINAAAGQHWVEIDPITERIFEMCEQLVFFTRGAFDPTALPLIQLWNWKANPPAIPSDSQIAAARELVGWEKVQRRPGGIYLPEAGMGIDLGGIGKEYAVDCVVELARHHGVEDVLVDFGQDVRAAGRVVRHIGLEDPKRPGRCWAGVAVQDMAVATSGDYLRCFTKDGRRYGHIIDARGMLKLKGKFANGSRVHERVPVAKDGTWALYLPTRGGALIGWMKLANGAVSGDVVWLPASP